MLKLLIGTATLALVAALALPALAAPTAQVIRVTERDYAVVLSARPKAGPTTFVVRNVGSDSHDLWLRGGGKTVKTRVLARGGTARLTINLKKGVRYTFWCSVGSHAKKGMRGSFVAR